VFLCRLVWWQNTSFNFVKRWFLTFLLLSVCCRSCRFLGWVLTFCSYKKLRTSFTNNYKYKQNIDSTITFSDKKPYLAISCNCCCRQYFLWRILFNTNDLGSFFRQFGSFLKMYDIYLKMYDIILLMYDINLKMYDIFLLMYAIYLKMYSIILLMYRSFLN
jgi:hypothetical protein